MEGQTAQGAELTDMAKTKEHTAAQKTYPKGQEQEKEEELCQLGLSTCINRPRKCTLFDDLGCRAIDRVVWCVFKNKSGLSKQVRRRTSQYESHQTAAKEWSIPLMPLAWWLAHCQL
jgi:hypothetical protein